MGSIGSLVESTNEFDTANEYWWCQLGNATISCFDHKLDKCRAQVESTAGPIPLPYGPHLTMMSEDDSR